MRHCIHVNSQQPTKWVRQVSVRWRPRLRIRACLVIVWGSASRGSVDLVASIYLPTVFRDTNKVYPSSLILSKTYMKGHQVLVLLGLRKAVARA